MPEADIFVNYRTSDEAASAAHIAEGLAERFGRDRVFWDHGSIKAGERYSERLRTASRRCTVLIAVIGDRWLDARDARGHRRLENENDWTRREIVEVLERGAHLVPVLVAPRTEPLQPAELPDALTELADLQFRQFNPRTKESDLATLVRDLTQLLPGCGDTAAPAAPDAGTVRNEVYSGPGRTVRMRDVSGEFRSLVTNPQAPVHSGNGDQHNIAHQDNTSHQDNSTHDHSTHDTSTHSPDFTGGQVNYVAGANSGGMHHNTGTSAAAGAEEDEDR